MNIWALSDPHLSFRRPKPMHVFGEGWRNHWEKIARGWCARVAPEDVVLVTGDISWGRRFEHALPDLAWLAALPGRRKLIVRGNHDHWWPESPAQHASLPASLHLLEGDAVRIGGHAFCGTGGWLSPTDPYFDALDEKPYRRELAALERALTRGAALAAEALHVLVHFSPYTSRGLPTAFDRLLRRFPVRTVTYGHFHFRQEWAVAPLGLVEGIHYQLASADFIDFAPVRLPT